MDERGGRIIRFVACALFVMATAIFPLFADDIAFNISHGDTINYTTIIAAVEAASANDTILVTPGTHIEAGTITISVSLNIMSTTLVSTDVLIDGGGDGLGNGHRIFLITDNAAVSISYLTLQNGEMTGSGAGVLLNSGTLFMEYIRALNCTANGSSPDGYGGFLAVQPGTVATVNNSEFLNNNAALYGGVLLLRRRK